MSIKKKARNKEATIKKIYNTFFKLVLEEGFHKASTNKIAKEAKISIGTLYHHFPDGKKGIIRKYFENSVETSFELEEFKKFNMSNIPSVFRGFVSNVLKNHKENKAYNLAFRSAILSDENLAQLYIKGSEGYLLVMQAGQNAVLTVSTSKDARLGLIMLDCRRMCEKIAKLI
ncbi:unnamed protein product [marine sediment metagenome]|uniref:HTH tetR-type domain-containing protein n=1 Tax=marine sediment metagenome TaxID=412755 RepID=X1E3M0_9ZZZZ